MPVKKKHIPKKRPIAKAAPAKKTVRKRAVKKTPAAVRHIVTRKRAAQKQAAVHRRAVQHALVHVGGLCVVGAVLWLVSFLWLGWNAPEPVTVQRTVTVIATAYNSVPGQTDDTPCITANGFNLCEHGVEDVVAANGLPFGTRVRFPSLGSRIFTVQDRMNSRYGTDRVDIWFLSGEQARHFGARLLEMEILE